MPARRLPAPLGDGETRGPIVRFTFDGRDYEGHEGEPLAASLLAAGHLILSRSFRFHRPRGMMCATGQCGWCECEVDGRPSVRTCRVPVRDGMIVRGEHAAPSVEHDLLGLLDLGSRLVPPTFYHHRFLRPRALRKAYLDVLRWFGGRGRLTAGPREDHLGREAVHEETDVLVVGGGRSGLLAALGAAEAGARVVLLEAGPELTARSDADELVGRVRDAGVEIRTGATAVGWYSGTVAVLSERALSELRARTVVAATGSYERVPTVPGADRPGVMAARLVVILLDRYGVLPSQRALLVGEGHELASAGAALASAGADCVGPVPTAALRRIDGRTRVKAVRYCSDGAERRDDVDLVVFSDRSPNLDLVLASGATVEWRGGVLAPVADENGRTTVPSLFVAGSAAGRPAAEAADAGARRTGREAASVARGRMVVSIAEQPLDSRQGDLARSQNLGPVAPEPSAGAILCFCEDVRAWEVRKERASGYVDPELVKRRTGALTGPCQGKYCLVSFVCAMGEAAGDAGGVTLLPSARPPLLPIRLGDLAAADAADAADGAR